VGVIAAVVVDRIVSSVAGSVQRSRLTTGIVVAAAATSLVAIVDAAPSLWDPPVRRDHPAHEAVPGELIAAGRRLFSAKFDVREGAGRPEATGDSKPTMRAGRQRGINRIAGPDATSCAGCHNDPSVGGSGDVATTVFVGAHFSDPAILSAEPTDTSERNTNTIAGAGAVELLAREMSGTLRAQLHDALALSHSTGKPVRRLLSAKGVEFGEITARADGTYDTTRLEGIDADLVVKPFGRKGVFISLREFTVAALNQHHGMQAVERFGWEKTGMHDFDGDGVDDEVSIGQVTALTLFQATLPAPTNDPAGYTPAVRAGERDFRRVGCGTCHVPVLHLDATVFAEPNPDNRPGTVRPADVATVSVPLPLGGAIARADGGLAVTLYSDLKRHSICDAEVPELCNERLRQDNVPQDQFLTPRLWDVATSAPYGHRGDATTLSEIILQHGGEARRTRDAFVALSDKRKRQLVAFVAWLGSGDRSDQAPISPDQAGSR